jgi:phytoene desaturase
VGAGRPPLADDVTCVPMDPFYRIRFDDGSWFDYSGDPDRMRAEVARFSPDDVAGFERFVAEAEHCYRWASRSSAASPSTRWATCCAPCPA